MTVGSAEDRSRGRLTYRFCTTNGEWFEGKSRLISRSDVLAEGRIVPVFYMPEDPRKSVALPGTEFRISLPEDEAATRFQSVPVKS